MKNIPIGAYIRQQRRTLKLTQEQVCDGICDPVTLSRIETNKQTPGRNLLNALLQRLDMPDARYYALSSNHELEIEALKKEIVACNVTEKACEGLEKLQKLEDIADEDDRLAKQFVLRTKVLLKSLLGEYDLEKQLELLTKAICITVPQFEISKIENHLYTMDEIKIINQIGNTYSCMGQNEKATDIFNQLLEYVQRHHRETMVTVGALPMVLYNYARIMDLSEQYDEGAKYALKGKEACIQYGHYQCLPQCLEIYAECCYFLGKEKESIESYQQAYYLCKVVGRKNDLDIIKHEMKKYFNIDLEC